MTFKWGTVSPEFHSQDVGRAYLLDFRNVQGDVPFVCTNLGYESMDVRYVSSAKRSDSSIHQAWLQKVQQLGEAPCQATLPLLVTTCRTGPCLHDTLML